MLGVVKIGGAEGNRLDPLLSELAERTVAGERWVLVHGASGVMDRLCRERGLEIKMITSPSGYRSRYVGAEEREVFESAAGEYGATICGLLKGMNVEAGWLDPARCGSVAAKRKDVLRESVGGRIRIVRGNYSGTVTGVNAGSINDLLAGGIVPVMPPLGFDDESGLNINIDGDRLAAAVAGELRADVLIVLSNVPGLMKNLDDAESLITSGSLSEWEQLEHYAAGNMKRKLVACREALELGVPQVYLADGGQEAPLTNAMGGGATCLAR